MIRPGRRVEGVEGASTIFYAYTGTEMLLEHPSSGDTDYAYAGGMRIAKVTGYGGPSPTANYYTTDTLGSTRLVTSSTGSVAFYDNYQPYGQDNAASGSETYKFTGKPVSATTGLYPSIPPRRLNSVCIRTSPEALNLRSNDLRKGSVSGSSRPPPVP